MASTTVHSNVRTYDITTNVKTIIANTGHPRPDGVLEISTRAGDTLGSGTLSVVASNEASPAVGTAAHWSTIAGMEALEVGKTYRVRVSAGTVALALTGSSGASLSVQVI